MCMFCKSFCLFVLFLLAIVLSVLRITDPDYLFDIFKLFSLLFESAEVIVILMVCESSQFLLANRKYEKPSVKNNSITGGELRCSGRESSFCSTSGSRHVNLVTNPVTSHE
jgi:hypothetical protein